MRMYARACMCLWLEDLTGAMVGWYRYDLVGMNLFIASAKALVI